MAGSRVIFTAKGFVVIVRHRRILYNERGRKTRVTLFWDPQATVGWGRSGRLAAVRGAKHTMIPRPPAFETAAAISAYPTHIIPPWTMGFDIPSVVVNNVQMGIVAVTCKTAGLIGKEYSGVEEMRKGWTVKMLCERQHARTEPSSRTRPLEWDRPDYILSEKDGGEIAIILTGWPSRHQAVWRKHTMHPGGTTKNWPPNAILFLQFQDF